eukprot:1800456-Rhodomonas_salina.1
MVDVDAEKELQRLLDPVQWPVSVRAIRCRITAGGVVFDALVNWRSEGGHNDEGLTWVPFKQLC